MQVHYNAQMKEITLPGHQGYFVTEDGKVFSNKQGRLKQLTLGKNAKGYPRVQLKVNDKVQSQVVHRLVALMYIPNPDNLPQVNHKDEDKNNNHMSNLEWCTNHYNTVYSKAKRWLVTNPEGETFEVFNLTEWCRDNNINRGNLCNRGYANGYRAVKL